MNDQAAFLLRVAVFGLVSGIVYWFITYEPFGTVALLVLGGGPGFAGLVLIRHRRHGGERQSTADMLRRFIGVPPRDPPGPRSLEDSELAVLPGASLWPFAASLGLAIAGSGLIFGLWLVIVGLGLALYAGGGWVSAIMREARYGHLRPTGQAAGREDAEREWAGEDTSEQETIRRS